MNCEIILSPEDVESICNRTRGMVNLGSDPSYAAEQVAEELESRFGLRSVTSPENLPTVNTERLMIRLLVSDFLGDRQVFPLSTSQFLLTSAYSKLELSFGRIFDHLKFLKIL